MLGTVARGGDRSDPQRSDRDLVAGANVVGSGAAVAGFGMVGTRSGGRDQAQPTRNVVGVIVGIDHVGYAQSLGPRHLQVNVNVPAGVHDNCFAAVTQHVGGAAQVSVQHLLKEQGRSFRVFLTDSVHFV